MAFASVVYPGLYLQIIMRYVFEVLLSHSFMIDMNVNPDVQDLPEVHAFALLYKQYVCA